MRNIFLCLFVMLTPALATAQGASVPFGGLEHDSTLPIEISADQLAIDQQNGNVVFTGNVVVGQGDMRLSADTMRVQYSAGEGMTGEIHTILAEGNVVMVNGSEAAEADQAEYMVADGIVNLSGNVILTQGQNALSAGAMSIDLNTGTAQMSGRVGTILQPEGN